MKSERFRMSMITLFSSNKDSTVTTLINACSVFEDIDSYGYV